MIDPIIPPAFAEQCLRAYRRSAWLPSFISGPVRIKDRYLTLNDVECSISRVPLAIVPDQVPVPKPLRLFSIRLQRYLEPDEVI